jgi:hypothetical protein
VRVCVCGGGCSGDGLPELCFGKESRVCNIREGLLPLFMD